MTEWYVSEAKDCRGDSDPREGDLEQGWRSQCGSRGTRGGGQDLANGASGLCSKSRFYHFSEGAVNSLNCIEILGGENSAGAPES